MGNQLAGIAPSQIFPVEYYLADLPEFSHEANLGSTRFFKVARAKYKEGLTVVKVFAIHDPTLPLKYHKERLQEISNLFKSVPYCLPFQKYIITDKAAILIRTFIKDNLYDRISTRPFLNSIEKRWIAFQLLQCLQFCHKLGVCHGDIKLENIMITSWNSVMLTDFASFKPTYLPEDNPADFSYFFDTSRRRTCYIAPERFVKSLTSDSASNSTTSLILADDQMKSGDLVPCMDVFSLGCALTELFTEGHAPFDFSQLLSYRSGEYTPWKVLEKIDDLHIRELVRSMIEKEASKRLSIEEYLEQQRNNAFPEYFYTFLGEYVQSFTSQPIVSQDEKVHRLRKDIHHIIQIIRSREQDSISIDNNFSEGLVIIFTLLISTLRSLTHCTAKLNALEVLEALSAYLSPDIILDRMLPYMLSLIEDNNPKVRVAVIQTLTHCLNYVKSLPRSDSNIFPEYILPNLLSVAQDEAVIVRMAYAENIASLAETAMRFLELTQIKAAPEPDNTCSTDVSPSRSQVSYDHELLTLHELIQQSVTILLSDPANIVKQTLLEKGITRLCIFFGRQKGNDVLLSHMITYLNDKDDRHLRMAFFKAIVGVATFVGWQCCPIIKPLLQQGLTDPEEFVISKALYALLQLSELGLIQKQMLNELVAESIPLLIHPNLWVKQGAVGFVCAVATCLNLADLHCCLIPLLEPFLKHSIIQLKEIVLLNAIQEPIPRSIFDYLMKLNALRNLLDSLKYRKLMRSVTRSGHHPEYQELNAHMKTIYCRLQSDHMTEAVEDQIVAVQDYLLKAHAKKCISDSHSSSSEKNAGIIELGKIQVNPMTRKILLANPGQYEKSDRMAQRKKLDRKNYSGIESPTVLMNQEWQHMFGSHLAPLDQKSPSSPKFVDQKSDSPTQKSAMKDSNVTDSAFPEMDQSVDKSTESINSISSFSVAERSLKPNQCVPCQEELQLLILKKQQEFVHDEINREGCELNLKDEQIFSKSWKPPVGSLVAHLHEHRRCINRVLSFPDSTLFVSCSNDGTVKIWDCEKMEGKNVANRSKLTYSRLEGPVSCVTVCQNMKSIAAASDNGNIQVFRVCSESSKSPILHSRTLHLQEEGSAVDLSYFDTGSQSVLSYATVYGSIVGWDLRSPGTAWKLDSHPQYGLITSFCVDPCHCWLVLGTAIGKIICWDLRFQLPIATVSHPTGSRIRQLLLHPKHQSAVLAAVEGNNEISMWDIETQSRIKTLWASSAPALSQTQPSEHSVHSMCWTSNERGSALLTGGSDMTVRYWDLKTPENSSIVASPAKDPLVASYVNYRSRLIDGTEVIMETHVRQRPPSTEDVPRRYPEVPLPGHYDIISGLCTIQASQTLIVSGARNGVIKVWK